MAGTSSKLAPAIALGAGLLFVWSALRNKSILGAAQAAVQGKSPTTAASTPETAPNPNAIGNSINAAGAGTVVTGKGSLTHAALMALWISVGGSTATANNAACHAIQESTGNPLATSANPDGGTNVGLWQLDTPGGKGAGYSITQLKNPILNARVAVKGSNNGRDWSAWATPGC